MERVKPLDTASIGVKSFFVRKFLPTEIPIVPSFDTGSFKSTVLPVLST